MNCLPGHGQGLGVTVGGGISYITKGDGRDDYSPGFGGKIGLSRNFHVKEHGTLVLNIEHRWIRTASAPNALELSYFGMSLVGGRKFVDDRLNVAIGPSVMFLANAARYEVGRYYNETNSTDVGITVAMNYLFDFDPLFLQLGMESGIGLNKSPYPISGQHTRYLFFTTTWYGKRFKDDD